MRVLQGRNQVEMCAGDFARLASSYAGVDLDIGTGDGRFVLDHAAAHPDRLVVGLDPVAGAMGDAANRVNRRKTRQDNVLFIVASVEQMPEELAGVAQHVFINLPWGSLMRGLILPDDDVLRAIAAVGDSDACYRIIFNLRIFENPVPLEVRELPEVTPEYVNETLSERYRAAGIAITSARTLSPDELSGLRTSWSRRLSHRSPPPSIQICGRRI